MLNLNDDMDDLIRQAADEYPLKTDGKDWDKVLGGIELSKQSPPPNNINKRYWWLLLLLLPLILVLPFFRGRDNKVQQTSAATISNATASQQKRDANNAENNAGVTPAAAPAGSTSTMAIKGDVKENEAHTLPLQQPVITNKTAAKIGENEILVNEVNHQQKQPVFAKGDEWGLNDEPEPDDAMTGKNPGIQNNNAPGLPNSKPEPDGAKKSIQEPENLPAVAASENKTNENAVTKANDSSTAAVSKKEVVHTAPVKRKGLYAGAAASLDITSVKLHKVNKLGYSTSLLVGYRINNHWSVETGLMWDNKSYYSPGDYFDKSRTGIPEASYIHFLNGTCRMFEVPLNVKFDFNSKKLSGFYMSAGLSSYLMKKEDYEYHATNSGNYYVGKRTYNNSTNNIFSVANISGGYQFIFKNNHSLRIEPYLKVPLKGLGIGKLPFASTGISAAYTLPLH